MSEQPKSPLDDAPAEIKLAVDLIYLLETNEIDPETAKLKRRRLKDRANDLETT
ncbi:primosomal protein [Vibrio campbellii]|nr:primosomal protein [Vibrio campbellii]